MAASEPLASLCAAVVMAFRADVLGLCRQQRQFDVHAQSALGYIRGLDRAAMTLDHHGRAPAVWIHDPRPRGFHVTRRPEQTSPAPSDGPSRLEVVRYFKSSRRIS